MIIFSMNAKKRMSVVLLERMQLTKKLHKTSIIRPVIEPKVVHIVKDESNESNDSNEVGENISNSNDNKIVYRIGEEDSNVEKYIYMPEPVLEEPVIETLSDPLVKILEEEKVESKLDIVVKGVANKNSNKNSNKKKKKKQ
jgi:hypothetical protein